MCTFLPFHTIKTRIYVPISIYGCCILYICVLHRLFVGFSNFFPSKWTYKVAQKTNIYCHLSLCMCMCVFVHRQLGPCSNFKIYSYTYIYVYSEAKESKSNNVKTTTSFFFRTFYFFFEDCSVAIVDFWTMLFFARQRENNNQIIITKRKKNVIITVYSKHSPSHISFNTIFMKKKETRT